MTGLNHAWGILRNASARAAYDQARAEAQRTPEAPEPEVNHEMRTPMPASLRGTPSGSVLDFGRYAGWSLGQIATGDPEYLEWLARTPIGRSFHAEIRDLLATRAAAAAAAIATAERRPRRFRSR
jgi:broad specificity phosphatase PhoE